MVKFISIALLLVLQTFSNAHAQIDVQHYDFQLTLSDANDSLKGTAEITVKFLEATNQIFFNLASVKEGKGMQVQNVWSQNQRFSTTHVRDTLFINGRFKKDSVQTFVILYGGIPADGLIISKNKWGARTFFADNWPDRAHQWLPCNDRPNDKATVEFSVTAPSPYKVISNGVLIEEKALANGQTITHWKEEKKLPTKVMVIGAARFAVKDYSDSSVTPVSAWVYPQDSTKGFFDYALAAPIVKFFSDYIGPYPFEKLANVQSTTIFGGMENAGCIFYGENTVKGDRSNEALLAHEIAHQWFGNSATEKSFAHLWLSEGFATYFTHLYLEKKYGRDMLVKRLQKDRAEIIQFAKRWPHAVVDSASPLMDLLNANSYQKGGWVLHMLRTEVGDSLFQKIIQTYYNRYRFSNADTWAFEKVAEEISGKELKQFFQQWLATPGVPELAVQTVAQKNVLVVTLTQLQNTIFQFPLEIDVTGANGYKKKFVMLITSKHQVFTYTLDSPFQTYALDPDCMLLFTLRK